MIVENATHEYAELAHPEIRRVVIDSPRGLAPHPLVISVPAPEFVEREPPSAGQAAH